MNRQTRTLVVRDASILPALRSPVVATLGNLDGVHRGHQALLERINSVRGAGSSVVISFYPHPGAVLGKMPQVPLLTTLRQRVDILGGYGVDLFFLIHFTRAFSKIRAGDFIDRYLIDLLDIEHLVIGPDAHVGFEREGTPEFIERHLAARGRQVTVLPFVDSGSERISSKRIRAVVAEGDVAGAAELLGRLYRVSGFVERGDQRGRLIGFRTANVALGKYAVPAFGVYATWVTLQGRRYPAVTNIGVRPTFGGVRPTIESHLIGYSGEEFYGEAVGVEFVSRLRPEMKFPSVVELTDQIRHDVGVAQKVLGSPVSDSSS
ncbi:MAG: bifunctional riboflavin kinase and synthetase [Pseudomonadota bacterium]|jgi:riboflavin kinase/FMN adenylyltransferase